MDNDKRPDPRDTLLRRIFKNNKIVSVGEGLNDAECRLLRELLKNDSKEIEINKGFADAGWIRDDDRFVKNTPSGEIYMMRDALLVTDKMHSSGIVREHVKQIAEDMEHNLIKEPQK